MPPQPLRSASLGRKLTAPRGLFVRSLPFLLGIAMLAGACGSGSATTSATVSSTVAPTTTVFRQPGDPSLEICATGTVDKIDGQLTVGHVVGTPVRSATTTSTTCTYRLDRGSLRMQVDEATSPESARHRFKQDLSSAGAVTNVPNLGDAAFSDGSGMTVTLKGPTVLTIDVSKVPAKNDRTQIAQSLSFQILTTFNG